VRKQKVENYKQQRYISRSGKVQVKKRKEYVVDAAALIN